MLWSLIFILNLETGKPIDYSLVGNFPDYTTCHTEEIFQMKESSYIRKFACVQLTQADVAKHKEEKSQ